MKRSSLLLLASLFAASSFGQGFCFRAGLGYAIPQAGQTMDGTGTPYNGSVNYATRSYNIKAASFSAGVHTYAAFGYLFNKHVGVEVGADIGILPKKYSYQLKNVTFGSGVPGDVTIKQQALLPIFFTPALLVQSGGEKFNVFSRFGVAIPFSKDVTVDQIQVNAPGTGARTEEDFTFTMQNKFSLGFAAAAGIEYKLSNVFSVWAECSMLSLSLYTKHSELTAVTVNGNSYPTSSVTGAPPVNYNRSGILDTTGATQPAYSMPFSNFGFNVGIKIAMAKKSRTTARKEEGNRSKRPAPSRFR